MDSYEESISTGESACTPFLPLLCRYFISDISLKYMGPCLMSELASNSTADAYLNVEESGVFIQLSDKYEQSCENTRKGDHGATAKFWIFYIDLVQPYLLLDRACRMNDVDFYIYAIQQMCPIFFAAHCLNYARWMTRYYLNLLNMKHTHEGIHAVFERGALSIRCTSKSFSCCAIDLTLQQTVNKDAILEGHTVYFALLQLHGC